MTDLTQAIADVMFQHLPSGVPRGYVDHVAAVVVAEIRPTITTVAELDALPESTIILDGNGEIMKRCDREQNVWHFANIAEYEAPALPATVLYRPAD